MKTIWMTVLIISCMRVAGNDIVMQKSDSLKSGSIGNSTVVFYDSLQVKAARHKVTKWLYGTMICSLKDTVNQKELLSYEYYAYYKNKTIGSISIRSLKVFGTTFDDTARVT